MLSAVRQLASADAIALLTWVDDDIVEFTDCDPAIVATHVLRAPQSWRALEVPYVFDDLRPRRLLPSVLLLALPRPPAACCVVHGPLAHRGTPAASLVLAWYDAADVPPVIRRDPLCLRHLLVGGTQLARRTMAVPQSLLDAIMAQVPQGIIFVDGERNEAMVNAAAARWLRIPSGVASREELDAALDRVAMRARHPEFVRHEVIRLSRNDAERVADWTWELDGAGGTTLRVSSVPITDQNGSGRLWAFDDVSHERELLRQISHQRTIEEKLRQVQKLEMVGRLAASVAHDFNNLLTIIGGSAEMLGDLHLDPDRRSDLDNIGSATDRARRLTRQLLTFTRQQVEHSEQFLVDDRLRGTASLLGKVLAPSRLVLTLNASRAQVFADPNQLELALLNLLANARDAMPDGGVVTLSTSVEQLDGELRSGATSALTGAHVALTVRDTGTGFDEETRRRMFEPFFTTKPSGQGTGLGLATVLAIAQRAGGGVRCESTPGAGAVFTILLPLVHADGVTTDTPLTTPSVRGVHPIILLVDDDGGPRETLRRVLTHEGFEVLAVASGPEALLMLDERGTEIRLLLTDFMMPLMTGGQLLERVRERWPELPALVMSGFSPDAGTARDLERLRAGFIAKPFTGRQVAAMIRQRLGVAAAGAPATVPG
ncbi:MAG: response regulator [Gemmatimonadaceae bacterium]|nr:response regulator [Gemmatimonadaceae bacterium]